MTCFELTTETPEEMITLLRGLNLEGTKDEPVYKVQKPTILRPEDVQTEEGLGEAPKKAAPDENPLLKLAKELEDISFANLEPKDGRLVFKGARALKLISEYLETSMKGNVDIAQKLVQVINGK